MASRSILRLLDPRKGRRIPTGGKREKKTEFDKDRHLHQGRKFSADFERLEYLLATRHGYLQLREDPTGIAPERALVFVTKHSILDFNRAARKVGMEIISEVDLGDGNESGNLDTTGPTLYATMPTENVLRKLVSLWKKYSDGKKADKGYAPWWKLFDELAELRAWGPKDRFSENSKAELIEQLTYRGQDSIPVELEIWPVANKEQREKWKSEVREAINGIDGEVVDECSIDEEGFVYEAILAKFPAAEVQKMIDSTPSSTSAMQIDGVQFILPQTVAQTIVNQSDPVDVADTVEHSYHAELPCRAILLDGAVAQAHPVLKNGVAVEDVNGLDGSSDADNRKHGTRMASLILRGDLDSDGSLLLNSRLLSMQVLKDGTEESRSNEDKLFVDVMHKTLSLAFAEENPLAPDAFVVNLSVGVHNSMYAGQVSSLARLLDWFAYSKGILFVVSAGNIGEGLNLGQISGFEDLPQSEQKDIILTALKEQMWRRTLLSPGESLNSLTVGALSMDVSKKSSPTGNEISVFGDTEEVPHVSSACGLGHLRSVKPDILNVGGKQVLHITPVDKELRLKSDMRSATSGLFVANASVVKQERGRERGTSCAAALTTRTVLRAAQSLTMEGGPYEGQRLERRDLALLTRALVINSAYWPSNALDQYEIEKHQHGTKTSRAAEEVTRYYGFGRLNEELTREIPETGTTLVGLGEVRKDDALIYDVPLPQFLSNVRVGRDMKVTIAWFSPADPARARYRLAALRARPISEKSDFAEIAETDEDRENEIEMENWGLGMKGGPLRKNIVERGTVWSRYFVKDIERIPRIEEGTKLPIRVECRDASGGRLGKDEIIRFALAITIRLEERLLFDVHDEVRRLLSVPVGRDSFRQE